MSLHAFIACIKISAKELQRHPAKASLQREAFAFYTAVEAQVKR
jgi:hypothetical protein